VQLIWFDETPILVSRHFYCVPSRDLVLFAYWKHIQIHKVSPSRLKEVVVRCGKTGFEAHFEFDSY